MKGILQKLLQKRGIETTDQLSDEEKSTFENWQAILSKDQLTIEDIAKFCKSQIEVIEGKWKDLNVENVKKAEWIPYHNVYKTILLAISSPKAARESLEQQLVNLIK